MSFRDTVSNFFRYVAFFACVIAAALGGLYLYNRSKPEAPPAPAETADAPIRVPEKMEDPAEQFPSQWLQPVIASKLPALLANINEPYALGADFTTLEQRIQTAKTKDLSRRPAWNTAATLCREMRNLEAAQNSAVATLQQGPPEFAKGSGKHSKEDVKETAAKQEFFMKTAQVRWSSGVPQWKKKIDLLYARLKGEEKLSSGG